MPVPSTIHATPIVTTNQQMWAPRMISGPPVVERQSVLQGGGLSGGVGNLTRLGKGVLGLYGNVMGDCVTAV
jgi:hypothetical protein